MYQTGARTRAFQAPAAAVGRSHRQAASRQRLQCNAEARMEFIRGVEEPTVPEVRLTRAKDGSSGTAKFRFEQPSVFEADTSQGEITGLYMTDEEGEINTVDVQAKFVNGKPEAIEATYLMRTQVEWDRFMRFMERYAGENELSFDQTG